MQEPLDTRMKFVPTLSFENAIGNAGNKTTYYSGSFLFLGGGDFER